MIYTMKDLGYPRTSTDAMFQVTMEDGSTWQVPVQVIVDSRDCNYASDEEDTIGFIRKGSLSDYEITDWAGNNMNWSDLRDFAIQVPANPKKINWEDGWSNGQKEIVGTL